MKRILNLTFFLSVLIFTGCKSQEKTNLSDKELQNLIEQEKNTENRAKYGSSNQEIIIISDVQEVDKLLKQYDEIRKNKQTELTNKHKNKSLSERYKTGDKTVVPQIITILKGTDSKQKRELYNSLSRNFDESDDYNITEPELIRIILGNIDKPDDENSVIQLAGYMQLPGYVEVFENHLLSGKSKDIGRLVFWLGKEGSSIRALDYAGKLILTSKVDLEKDYWIMSGLEGFSQGGSEEVKKKTFELCFEIYNRKLISKSRFEEMKSSWSSGNPAYGLTNILLNHGDKQIIPFANELIKDGINKDQALNALIRLEGAKHKQLVMDNLNKKDSYYDALSPATMLYKITKDKALVESILKNFEKRNDLEDYSYQRIVSTLVEMGATEYLVNPGQIVKSNTVAASLKQFYELTKGSVEDVASDLFNMGVIDKPVPKETIEKAKAKNESDDSEGNTFNLLNEVGIFHWFDAETGIVPVDYDELILTLSKNSNGKFENIKAWMFASEKPDNTYTYRVCLYANNKVYIANPPDIGDWYEVETVLALLNTALKDSGLKERYVFIDTGDQTVQVMFGEEDKVKLFAEKYKL